MAIADKENQGNDTTMTIKLHGAIVRIVFHNFLTYDDVVCRPGPYLNVIIGPNGTGKSTIICGICLAVGGSPKVLGRSDQIGDFIKHGKESGFVELHMYDKAKKGARIFKISIHRPNSARYSVDGKHVSRDEHCQLIKQYNIQVNNPCTFLAQDKVKTFAEQDPKQLLKNTEKAGPESLSRMHAELEDFFKEGEAIRGRLADSRNRFDTLQQNIQTLKVRADNFKEREKRHFKINLLRKRKTLLAYTHQIELQKKEVKAMKKAEGELDRARNAIAPLNNRIKVAQKAVEKSETIAKEMHAKRNDYARQIENNAGTEAFEEALAGNASTFALVKRQFNTWETTKTKIAEELDSITILYEKAKTENEANPEFEQHKADILSAHQNLKTLERDIRLKRHELSQQKEELQRKVDVQQQRFGAKLQTIAGIIRNRGIIDAWDSYERNRRDFRYPVFIPFLHLEVINDRCLRYLNNTIGKRDMAMFIFGCKEDEERLMAGNRFSINTTVVDEQLCDRYREPSTLPDALRQMGFTEFLSELFNAPLPVRAFLCSIQQLDRIPIGGVGVDAKSEEIAKRVGKYFNLFLTDSSRISVVFSKYTGALYVKRSHLHNSILLSADHTQKLYDYSADFQKVQAEMTENTERTQKYERDKAELDKRMQIYRQEEQTIVEKRNQVTVLEDKVKRFQRRLQEFSKEKPNVEVAATAFEEKKRVLTAQAVRDIDRLVSAVESLRMCLVDAALANAEKERQRRLLFQLRGEVGNLETTLRECELTYETRRRDLEEMDGRICERKNAFLRACEERAEHPDRPEFSAKEKRLVAGLRKDFADYNLPDDDEAIEQQIGEECNRLEIGRVDGSQQDVEDYDRLVRECTDVEEAITRQRTMNDEWGVAMDERLNKWLDPLKVLVNRINENYSRFFRHLTGCAGSVELKIADDKYNINEYGIVISVKFRRDNELRPLTHQTQSGGERSVATMLYLMALQDLCPVPFRCVDEINQGMDPNNERLVFNMMVGLLSASGEVAKTQYFLLTPKLLGGLVFNDRVTVHVVHNGPTIKNAEAWNPENFLRSLMA